MSSAFKKTQKAAARPHRERSQPGFRKKLGLLEKKKDYKLRADNFKKKEKRIFDLKRKAEFKNPDEFYFGMINSRLVDGVHTKNTEGMTKEEIAIAETNDARYIKDRILREKRKIERLRNSIQIYQGEEQLNNQVFFIDDDEDEDQDIAEKLDIEPELVDRVYNRPRKGQLENMAEVDLNPHKANQERKKTMRELDQRINRLAKMEKALKMLETAAEEREEENKPEVVNGKLAKKYNFVQLRKK